MKNGLYHIEGLWLDEFNDFFEKHKLKNIEFSKHYLERERSDKNRLYDLKDITLDFVKTGKIFEIEVKDNRIFKIAVRCKYKNGYDLCMAFTVDRNTLICRTAYTNKNDDEHYTLNIKKYMQGESKSKEITRATASIFDINSKKRK